MSDKAAPAEEAAVEETHTVEAPAEEAVAVEETETPAEVSAVEEVAEVPVVETETELIERFKTKNEQGRLTQQEFFRIFLISVQNSLTINQRVSAVEKKLEEAESGVEDNTDTLDNGKETAPSIEEDGPLEDGIPKELKDKCKTFGLSDKGK